MRFEFDGAVLQGLTFSAGVADNGDAAQQLPLHLLRAADLAVLAAKRGGRARIVGDTATAAAGMS